MHARTAQSGGLRHTPSSPRALRTRNHHRRLTAGLAVSPQTTATFSPATVAPRTCRSQTAPHPLSITLAPPSPQPPSLSPVDIVASRSVVSPPLISLSPRTLFLAAAVLRCCGTRPWRSPRRSNRALPLPPPPHLLWQAPSPSSLYPLFLPPYANRHGWGSAKPAQLPSSLDRPGAHARCSLHDMPACAAYPRHPDTASCSPGAAAYASRVTCPLCSRSCPCATCPGTACSTGSWPCCRAHGRRLPCAWLPV